MGRRETGLLPVDERRVLPQKVARETSDRFAKLPLVLLRYAVLLQLHPEPPVPNRALGHLLKFERGPMAATVATIQSTRAGGGGGIHFNAVCRFEQTQ